MIMRRLGGRDVALVAVALPLGLAYAAARSPFVALAAVAAVVLIAWIVARAELVLMVVVASVPWEAMLEYPSATVSVAKLLGVALGAAYVFRAATRDEPVRFPPTIVAALLLGMAIGLSVIFSTDPAGSVPKAFRYAFFIVFLFLITQIVQDRATAYRLLRVLCVSTTAAAVYGLVSFLSGMTERAAGPLHDPNDFAYLISTVIPIAVLLLIEDRHLRPLWGASLAILLAATLATLSRGALVGLGALLVWAILSRRIGAGGLIWTAVGATTVVLLALALWSPLINERLEQKGNIGQRNADSRIAFWSAAARMSLDRPITGVGPDRFGAESSPYLRNNPIALDNPVVHNSYLEVLVENGVLAFAAFIGLLAAAWNSTKRAEIDRLEDEDRSGARLAVAVKAMLIVAIVSGVFLSEQLTVPFWIACGVAGSGALAVSRSRPALDRSTAVPAPA